MSTITRKKSPKKQATRIFAIIDESGSMGPVASDVRGGFNSYIEQLRNDGNTYAGVTIIKFNRNIRTLCRNKPLKTIEQLNEVSYHPEGLTALYDAIAYGLSEAESYGSEDYPYGTEKVIFVIMTDGLENASREYGHQRILEEIEKRKQAGNWTFVCMLADIDAWGVGDSLKIAVGNTLKYEPGQTMQAFAALADATEMASASPARYTTSFFSGETPKPVSGEEQTGA